MTDFNYQQRAATNEYRDGWDLIWGKKVNSLLDKTVEEVEKDQIESSNNQCDGCNAGYPIDGNGLHQVPYPSGTMVCQKSKYKENKP